jgi:hypothetical protein
MFISPGSRAKTGGKAFPKGTQMTFINPAAPLGWVRVSTFDDALMRIVGSTAPGSGGTNGFVATVNSQTGTGTGSTGTGNTGTGSTGTGSTGTGTAGSTAIVAGTSPDHTHGYTATQNSNLTVNTLCGVQVANAGVVGASTAGAGFSGGSHNHTVPALTVPSLSVPALTVPSLTVPSLSVTFGIKYVDCLIAKKS